MRFRNTCTSRGYPRTAVVSWVASAAAVRAADPQAVPSTSPSFFQDVLVLCQLLFITPVPSGPYHTVHPQSYCSATLSVNIHALSI